MSSASKPRIILQLVAIALHSFLFSAFVLAALPQIGDRLRVAEPLLESRLATLNEFTDSATIARGVKRSGSQSLPPAVAFAVFHSPQIQPVYRLSREHSDRSGHRTVSGFLADSIPTFNSFAIISRSFFLAIDLALQASVGRDCVAVAKRAPMSC